MQIDFTIPSQHTASELGKVNIHKVNQDFQIQCTILMEPTGQDAEGWQTGVALDASASMQGWYGRKLLGTVPKEVSKDYQAKGWIQEIVKDQERFLVYQQQAYEQAVASGYLEHSENIVQPKAQEFITYLAGNLDSDGGTTLIYWACGEKGEEIEVVGDFRETECNSLSVVGPANTPFGSGTRLMPAMKYFVERFSDSPRGMYLFITDGKLDDLEAVKQYTTQLAGAIAAQTQNLIKCVLIGVGDQIDESQMIELDDLETGTDIDIWDHKISQDMRDLTEIFAEVVDENNIIAPTGIVYDSKGQTVKRFTDGLPARLEFVMPATSDWFDLEVGEHRIRQKIVLPERDNSLQSRED